jgi:phospholipase C
MAGPGREDAIDHVVVVMFENRSFDNLLGRLYAPGEVASFEGVLGRELTNPIPEWAEHPGPDGLVPYGVPADMNTPCPDPGEEYQHVNTQLFGLIDPPSNRGVRAARMRAPYNEPADPHPVPTMDGFVADYISAFAAETGRQPTYEQYAPIMTGYTPEQMPVFTTLARHFTTFDHWFCEVPSQTFTNRSFMHAATASGFVVNMDPPDAFPVHNRAETVFERLSAKGLMWRVYCDPPSHVSFTGVIHASRLHRYFKSNFFTTDRFLEDAEAGTLPAYSFIEPNLLYGHNDMHPAMSAVFHGLAVDPPSPLLGGEQMLARIYDAVRTSSSATGSNALNTLLLVTFDEPGGTYDHVPPPAAAPPDPAAPAGQFGFRFDRSGLRVPAVAVSAWAPERAVVNEEHRHTSVIATLRERWSLGPPLTARDAGARGLAPVLALDAPRTPAGWPEVSPRPVPAFVPAHLPAGAPMSALQRSALFSLVALAKRLDQSVPVLKQDAEIKGAEAIEMIADVFGHLFPGLRAH